MSAKESIDHFLEVGLAAVKQAGEIVAKMQESSKLEVSFKGDGSPTTNADQNAEKRMIEIISSAYPNHRLRGEEFGWHNQESDSPYLWVFDPVDGTWAFLNQENTACVNLALIRDGVPIVGIVCNPFTEELYQTAEGRGSTLNGGGLPIPRLVRKEDRLGVLSYQLSRGFRQDIDLLLDIWERKSIGKLVAPGGSPAYCLALVAKGAHNSFVTGLRRESDPWDFPAGVLLVRNAGGKVTDLEGNDIDPVKLTGYMVASSFPHEHEHALTLLGECGFGSVAAAYPTPDVAIGGS